jgi:hypothetical protein
MESPSSLIRERLNSSEDQICPECGHLFRPSGPREETEELCEICSAAELDPPNRVARWQATPKRAGRAAR